MRWDSGLADPAHSSRSRDAYLRRFASRPVVTTIDTIAGPASWRAFPKRRTGGSADLLVLTKTDLAPRPELLHWRRSPDRCRVVDGPRSIAAALFGGARSLAAAAPRLEAVHAHGIAALCIRLRRRMTRSSSPWPWAGGREHGESLLRVKGLLAFADVTAGGRHPCRAAHTLSAALLADWPDGDIQPLVSSSGISSRRRSCHYHAGIR